MLRNRLAVLAWVGLVTGVAGCQKPEVAKPAVEGPAAAAARETANTVADDAPEVAFPELPPGAGKIDENAPRTFTSTGSGLKYRILRAGSGPKPTAQQSVEVHYHGWLDNKKVFDSSYERGETISFGLTDVIRGWTEGMQLVGKGGMIELVIPGKLGYGQRGSPPNIGPNATLHFLVELKNIK